MLKKLLFGAKPLGAKPLSTSQSTNSHQIALSPITQNCALLQKHFIFLTHTRIRRSCLRRWRFSLEDCIHNMGRDVSGMSPPDAELTSSLLWLQIPITVNLTDDSWEKKQIKKKQKERENETLSSAVSVKTQWYTNYLKFKSKAVSTGEIKKEFFIANWKYLGKMSRQIIVCNQRNCLFKNNLILHCLGKHCWTWHHAHATMDKYRHIFSELSKRNGLIL